MFEHNLPKLVIVAIIISNIIVISSIIAVIIVAKQTFLAIIPIGLSAGRVATLGI